MSQYITSLTNICNEFMFWNVGDIVFIGAGTGKGKTTFIKKELLEYAICTGRSILLLINRRSLNDQVTAELEKYFYESHHTMYMQNIISGGATHLPIEVRTYQWLEATQIMNAEWLKSYLDDFFYIVADESHYFLTDAVFNGNTFVSYHVIKKIRKDKVIIYISATQERIKQKLLSEYSAENIQRVWEYNCNNNYENVDILYGNNLEDIVEYVVERGEKTLFCIPSISEGLKIQHIFEKKYNGKRVYLIDASVKDKAKSIEQKIYNEIVETQKFTEDILLVTSFLENGISIVDDSLKIIVNLHSFYEPFMQSLGRKRIQENEKMTLILMQRSTKYYFNKLHTEIYSYIRHYITYVKQEPFTNAFLMSYDKEFKKNVEKFTYLKKDMPGFRCVNPLSYCEVESRKRWLEYYIYAINLTGERTVINLQAFFWLGKTIDKIYPIRLKRENARSLLYEKLINLIGRKLTKQEAIKEFNSLRSYMEAIGPLPKGMKTTDNISDNRMNQFFRQEGFCFTVIKHKGENRKMEYEIIPETLMVTIVDKPILDSD